MDDGDKIHYGLPMHPAPASLLDLRLFPHRSLDRRQFRWLMLSLTGVCALAGLRFLVLGAWPVAAFLMLDVVLVWGAFRLNYHAARAYEEVRLADHQLCVRQVDPWGRERITRFNPAWVRVVLDRLHDGVQRLFLAGQGQRVMIGGFLTPDERVEVAGAIRAALGAYRA